MAADFRVDVTELRKLAADLQKISPALRQDLYKGLTAAGELVASDARRRAAAGAGHTRGSKRIPPSIKVRRRGTTVKVTAGGDAAPNAAPLDHKGIGGTFRHPVFGDRTNWVAQSAVPFLEPAGEANSARVEALVIERVVGTLSKLGF